jgi:hypothetical protein
VRERERARERVSVRDGNIRSVCSRVISGLSCFVLRALTLTNTQGYVDDPRNTDNAWVETSVAHVHDTTGEFFDYFLFGEDTDKVCIMCSPFPLSQH